MKELLDAVSVAMEFLKYGVAVPFAVAVVAIVIMVAGTIHGMRDHSPVHLDPPMGG